MTAVDSLHIAIRVGHILAAIALLGGTGFIALSLLPAMRIASDDLSSSLMDIAMKRFVPILHASVLILLITGFYNFFVTNFDAYRVAGRLGYPIHAIIGMKMLLGIIAMGFAIVGLLKRIQNRVLWLKLHLVLGLLVVILGAITRQMRLNVMDLQPLPERTDSLSGNIEYAILMVSFTI